MSHYALQQYWWVIISLLAAILVFLFFVQGGQMLIYSLGRTDKERKMIVNALGRKWEFTFTTLVTFGGAFFASFPLFYATSFGGAYWVWMLILLAFVIQAVSYEFRSKPGNVFGHHVYERLLYINGLVGTLLTGTAVATFFTGSSFFVSELNQPEWKSSFHGLELAFDLTRYETFINLSLGLAVFFLSRVLGTLYLLNSVDDMLIVERSKRHLKINGMAFIFFFAFFTLNLLLLNGYAYDPITGAVYRQPFKYLHNFLEMPYLLLLFLAGASLVVFPLWMSRKRFGHFAPKAIWYAGPGTILVVFSLMLCAGLNETAFYPSIYDLQSSLTIRNASSSHYTLAAMSYVSLLVPFVAAYIWYAWRAINRKKIDAKEMDEETHTY